MSIDYKEIIEKSDFEKTNIFTGVESVYQDDLIDRFLMKSYEKGVMFESIIIDTKELLKNFKNIHSSINNDYTEELIFSMNLQNLKNFSNHFRKERFTFYKNLYEEYIALFIYLKIGLSDDDRCAYLERKEVIERGDLSLIIGGDKLCDSFIFFENKKYIDIQKIVFLKNAQYIVDYNLQEAIDCFIELGSDSFRFNVVTASDYLLSRSGKDYDDDVVIVNYQKTNKKNTK